MHIRDDRVYQFCESLYPLIREVDVYVGEMDLHPIDLQINLPRYSMKEQFALPVYFKMRKQILKSFKVDVERYDHLHPLMIMSAVSHTILETDHKVSLDEHLWNFAKDNELNLQGLESAQEQIDLLHSIDPEPLYKQIRDISGSPSKLRSFTSRALNHYVKGEIHPLYQLTKSSMHDLRKTVIYRRNEGMVRRILSFDTSNSYFITVGAGHLSGKRGILTMLRKAGYQVKPFKIAVP
jgi:uncharacterized protein